MSVLLTKVVWYRKSDPDTPILITDSIDMSVARGIDIKNNIVVLRLKNYSTKFDVDENIEHQYVDSNFNIKFEEEDQIKIYLKYTDDMADVESNTWSDAEDYAGTHPSNIDLKGTYYVVEFDVEEDEKGSFIRVKCADKCYILFNRLLAKAFIKADAINAPEMLQKVVRYSSENQDGAYTGTSPDGGVIYDVDAKLFSSSIKTSGTTTSASTNKLINTGDTFKTDGVSIGDWVKNTTDDVYAYVTSIDSETQLTLNRDIMASSESYSISDGFIQDVRTTLCADGTTANAVTTFPDISLAKVWKPVYEWVGELSQIDYINTSGELDDTDTLVYGKSFLYFVDELNRFHWFECTNDVDEEIVIGTTTGIYQYKLVKKVFDIVNFVIFRGGEDFYGKGTLGYEIDQSAGMRNLKMRVIAMTDIAKKLIQREIADGNLVSNTTGTFTFAGNRYNKKAGDVTPHWSSDTFANDALYNTELRRKIMEDGRAKARKYLVRLAHARYKGSIERKGTIQTVGDLLKITNKNTGQVEKLLRVMDVRDKINSTGWFTTLMIEEDKEAVTAGDRTST